MIGLPFPACPLSVWLPSLAKIILARFQDNKKATTALLDDCLMIAAITNGID